jgi:hypothetical protein
MHFFGMILRVSKTNFSPSQNSGKYMIQYSVTLCFAHRVCYVFPTILTVNGDYFLREV